MEFVAIDVETANPDMASICQIGMVHYHGGALIEEWMSYVDPEDYFDSRNTLIHRIDQSIVAGYPNLPGVAESIYKFLDNRIVVCHTHFDRVALKKAFDKYCRPHPKCIWLDSSSVARRTWDEFAWKGYGLQNICYHLGYPYNKPHDAFEDAKACAYVFLKAMENTGLTANEWLKRVNKRINFNKASDSKIENPIKGIIRNGNPEGPLYGEILVFTGELRIDRHVAEEMAAKIGCHVARSVTNKTTVLVVGNQDIRKLAGHEKSSKHRKAEDLISKGLEIRILKESDFEDMVSFY